MATRLIVHSENDKAFDGLLVRSSACYFVPVFYSNNWFYLLWWDITGVNEEDIAWEYYDNFLYLYSPFKKICVSAPMDIIDEKLSASFVGNKLVISCPLTV